MHKAGARWVLAAAVFAYFVSIIERSSMGVASLEAAKKFEVGAATLSALAVAQLIVYAAMQIPVGLLLDRFGPRRLIVTGSITTGIGNMMVAIAPSFGVAVVGRMIVGLGDAFVFISMIRLINSWIPGSKATRFTQLFANIGQLGQIASAVPFAYLLNAHGWNAAFTAASSFAFAAATMGMLIIRDSPGPRSFETTRHSLLDQLKINLKDAFTRKAFWVHFSLQSSGSLFILLWGYPFLISGEGLNHTVAALLMGSFVFIGFAVGPLISGLCIRFPKQRHILVTAIGGLIIANWLLVLLTPGRNPLWQLVLLVLVIGSGGPASMIAFDYSRTSIPPHRLGSANGVINTGGFVATFSSMFLIGLALDVIHKYRLAGETQLFSLEAFRLAFPLQLVVICIGIIAFHLERGKTQRRNR